MEPWWLGGVGWEEGGEAFLVEHSALLGGPVLCDQTAGDKARGAMNPGSGREPGVTPERAQWRETCLPGLGCVQLAGKGPLPGSSSGAAWVLRGRAVGLGQGGPASQSSTGSLSGGLFPPTRPILPSLPSYLCFSVLCCSLFGNTLPPRVCLKNHTTTTT